jgi:hypothetical protein
MRVPASRRFTRSAFIRLITRSEPDGMTRLGPEPDQPHIRSPFATAAPGSRLRRTGAQEDGTILKQRPFGAMAPLGSSTWILQD